MDEYKVYFSTLQHQTIEHRSMYLIVEIIDCHAVAPLQMFLFFLKLLSLLVLHTVII